MTNNILKYFNNVQEQITPNDLQLVVELFVEEYGKLRISEIDLIFRYAIKGKLGPTFEKINIERIMFWSNEYLKLRTGWLASNQHLRHNQVKKGGEYVKPSPAILQAMKDRDERDKDTHLNHRVRKLKRKLS